MGAGEDATSFSPGIAWIVLINQDDSILMKGGNDLLLLVILEEWGGCGRVWEKEKGRESIEYREAPLLICCEQSIGLNMVAPRTRMNNHAHPGLPPTPSMRMIAAASRPENAYAKDTAEYIIDPLNTKSEWPL